MSYDGETPVRFTGKWGKWPLPQSHTSQSLSPPEYAQISTFQPSWLTSQPSTSSAEWGYCIPLGWCRKKQTASTKKDGVFGVGEWQTQVSWQLSIHSLSPEPQTPVSPHMILVTPLAPQVSGCKQDFVFWPLKRKPVSLEDSHLFPGDRIPVDFHIQLLCGRLFLALVLWAGEPAQLWLEMPLLRGKPPTPEMSLQNVSCCPWKQGQPFLCLCPPYQSQCGFFGKASLPLVFSSVSL